MDHTKKETIAAKEEKDICVICSSKTNYAKSDNISERVGYVEGVGQLCEACFKRCRKGYGDTLILPDDIILDEEYPPA